MNKNDFSLAKTNTELLDCIENEELDFINIIARDFDNNLGVVGKYMPRFKEKGMFMKLNENLDVVPVESGETPYYGISPKIDNRIIIEQISEFHFSTLAGVDAFIRAHADCFMLHDYQKDYLLPFARYVLLAFASIFTVRFSMENLDTIPEIRDILKRGDCTVSYSNGVLQLWGCPTEELLRIFRKYQFKKKRNKLWTVSDSGGKTIDDIYRESENITLGGSHVFYSGTLLRPIRLEINKNLYENYKTDTITIFFEQTSYATVFALDNIFTAHPVLQACRHNLTEMFLADDRAKRNLYYGLKECDKQGTGIDSKLTVINAYLSECFNVNQIGVSANIITKDGLLLMGERNHGAIDDGCLYPGVNGNAEIADRNVPFYQYAIQEDYPAIVLSEQNIRFGGEIQREASEELQIDSDAKEYKCGCIIISGNTPPKSDIINYQKRRLHFNILFEHKSKLVFEELEQNGRMANEAYENKRFIGFQIKTFKSQADRFWQGLISSFQLISENTDFCESILLLILSFLGILQGRDIPLGIWDFISIVLSVFVLIGSAIKIKQWIQKKNRRSKQCTRFFVIAGDSYETMNQRIRKAVAKYSYHPVARAALQYHIEKMAYDTITPKDRR